MSTDIIKLYDTKNLRFLAQYAAKKGEPLLVFIIMLLLWSLGPQLLHELDETAGTIDQGIWLLILLSMISFMLLCALCWRLLQYFWHKLGLPELNYLISQFNTLSVWQQLSFYWASFALLLLAALGCLAAIC